VFGTMKKGGGFPYIIAANITTGVLLWGFRADPHVAAMITQSPTVHGGFAYVGVSSLEELIADNPDYEWCVAGKSGSHWQGWRRCPGPLRASCFPPALEKCLKSKAYAGSRQGAQHFHSTSNFAPSFTNTFDFSAHHLECYPIHIYLGYPIHPVLLLALPLLGAIALLAAAPSLATCSRSTWPQVSGSLWCFSAQSFADLSSTIIEPPDSSCSPICAQPAAESLHVLCHRSQGVVHPVLEVATSGALGIAMILQHTIICA
jgi:hypothetical protein